MGQPGRVVHLVRPGPPELRQQVVALASGLVARRWETFVVGPLERGFREELSRGLVRWVNLPLPTSLSWREQSSAAQAVGRFLAAAGPTLVHAHGFQAALTATLALRRLRVPPPLVVTPYGIPPLPHAGRLMRRLRHWGYRSVLRRSAAVIATSPTERRALVGLMGAQAKDADERIHVVLPGIERRRASSLFDVGQKRRSVGLHQDAAVVATVASLDQATPVEHFLRAAALVSEEVANVEFAVIGGGAHLEGLRTLAHELRLSGSTVFLGERADAHDIVAACNVLVALGDDAWAVPQALQALAREVRVVAADSPVLCEAFGEVGEVPVVPLTDHRALGAAVRGQLEGMTTEEDAIQAATGLRWGLSEIMVSQEEYDLDKPGLDPRERGKSESSAVDRLLASHSLANMLDGTTAVYERVLASRGQV